VTHGADLVIEISDVNKQQDGHYRLNYDPPFGYPPPNTTIASSEIGDSIQFSKALPGTNYNFWLYYTNQTHKDWLTWRVQITTGILTFDIFLSTLRLNSQCFY
jgi:receptor-type tyrosine-protein phosphatase beta